MTISFYWNWLFWDVAASEKNLSLECNWWEGLAEANCLTTKAARRDLILQNTRTQLMTLGFSSEDDRPTGLIFGRDRWKNMVKCRKMVIFSGLKEGIVPCYPWHTRTQYNFSHLVHSPQSSKSTKKFLKTVLLHKFQTYSSIIFYPLPWSLF